MTDISVRLDLAEATFGGIDVLWRDRQGDPITAGFGTLFAGLQPPDEALDLLLVACSVYAADKAVRRDLTVDGWTRDIVLDIPQIDPDRMPLGDLRQLLLFLTGDRWELMTHPTDHAHQRLGVPQAAELSLQRAVALFSGGLDSFAYAVSAPQDPTVFIAQRDRSGLSPRQQDLFASIAAADWQLRQFSFTVNRTGDLAHVGDLEGSTRSRSLLFYATSIAVAAAVGAAEVTVPENGFVSLNPPLVEARRGSLSTRTTHPWTLELLRRVVAGVGLPIGLVNPFMFETKGDITARALAHAPERIMFQTVSCAHPRPRNASTLHFGHCGYCFPCLVRRAGIEAHVNDKTRYRQDPRTNRSVIESRDKGDDFRAVISRARRAFTITDLTVTAPLPRGAGLAAGFLDVAERSRDELAAMIDRRISGPVRRLAGW